MAKVTNTTTSGFLSLDWDASWCAIFKIITNVVNDITEQTKTNLIT